MSFQKIIFGDTVILHEPQLLFSDGEKYVGTSRVVRHANGRNIIELRDRGRVIDSQVLIKVER